MIRKNRRRVVVLASGAILLQTTGCLGLPVSTDVGVFLTVAAAAIGLGIANYFTLRSIA